MKGVENDESRVEDCGVRGKSRFLVSPRLSNDNPQDRRAKIMSAVDF